MRVKQQPITLTCFGRRHRFAVVRRSASPLHFVVCAGAWVARRRSSAQCTQAYSKAACPVRLFCTMAPALAYLRPASTSSHLRERNLSQMHEQQRMDLRANNQNNCERPEMAVTPTSGFAKFFVHTSAGAFARAEKTVPRPTKRPSLWTRRPPPRPRNTPRIAINLKAPSSLRSP